MQEWFEVEGLGKETHGKNVHEYANTIMNTLKEKTDEFFPFKTRKVSSDNQPFFCEKLVTLKRKKQREYNKHRKSEKWVRLNLQYNNKLDNAKKLYYKKEISKLKKSEPKKWFQWLKRLVSSDQANEQDIIVEEINHLPKEIQAERIADSFASISQEYEELKYSDINLPSFNREDIPIISVKSVETCLNQIKINKATNKNVIPAI